MVRTYLDRTSQLYLSGNVSVLIPTRGRPDLLRESVSSLLDLAAAPNGVEILLGIDPDDIPPPDIPGTRPIVMPQRYGYRLLHEYYNGLGRAALGDWLFIWNDDAIMRTAHWDHRIREQPAALLWPYVPEAQGMNVFPVVPRAWFKRIGHFSLNHSIDMWLIDVGSKLERRVRHVPITVNHRKILDETARQRDITADVMTFHEADMRAARDDEAAALRDMFGPGNRHLVSVVFPTIDGIGGHVSNLVANAEWPQDTEFLVAGWNRAEYIRTELEQAGFMDMSEVHPSGDLGYVRSQAHGAHVLDFGTFPGDFGWDTDIRKGLGDGR